LPCPVCLSLALYLSLSFFLFVFVFFSCLDLDLYLIVPLVFVVGNMHPVLGDILCVFILWALDRLFGSFVDRRARWFAIHTGLMSCLLSCVVVVVVARVMFVFFVCLLVLFVFVFSLACPLSLYVSIREPEGCNPFSSLPVSICTFSPCQGPTFCYRYRFNTPFPPISGKLFCRRYWFQRLHHFPHGPFECRGLKGIFFLSVS
jgi:hypothetical protein